MSVKIEVVKKDSLRLSISGELSEATVGASIPKNTKDSIMHTLKLRNRPHEYSLEFAPPLRDGRLHPLNESSTILYHVETVRVMFALVPAPH